MAIDNTPPRLKLIVTIAVITVVTLDPAGAQGDREPVRREFDGGGLSDAGGGAGHDRRPTFGQGGKARHQRVSTVTGRWANPRTLLEWTRTALASSTS